MAEEPKLVRLLAAYREMQAVEAKKCEKIDMQLADLQAQRQVLVGDLHEKMRKVEYAIENEVLELGQTYSHPLYGKVGYRNGYTKSKWDTKALEDLAETNKRLWNQIKKFRGETVVSASVKIE
jgi:hypothetical protein